MMVRRATANSRANAEMFGRARDFASVAAMLFCRASRSVERLRRELRRGAPFDYQTARSDERAGEAVHWNQEHGQATGLRQ